MYMPRFNADVQKPNPRNTMSSAATSNNNQSKTAKEVIAANVQSLIEQLEAGHSDALTAYLNAMSRFHNYSFGNILEIARRKPDATSGLAYGLGKTVDT
jgi:hypothetical protein